MYALRMLCQEASVCMHCVCCVRRLQAAATRPACVGCVCVCVSVSVCICVCVCVCVCVDGLYVGGISPSATYGRIRPSGTVGLSESTIPIRVYNQNRLPPLEGSDRRGLSLSGCGCRLYLSEGRGRRRLCLSEGRGRRLQEEFQL